jgi:hypothetical protein
VHDPGEGGEAVEEGRGWGVEEIVGNRDDAAVANGREVLPAAAGDDFGERDAVAGAAPGEDEEVGVGGGYGLGRGVGAGGAEELAAGGVDEFGDPGLGVDEGLAPLFAVDEGLCGRGLGCVTGLAEGAAHLFEDAIGGGGSVGDGAEEADVGGDGGKVVGGEGQGGDAGFEDGGEGFELIGEAGDDEVGVGGAEGFEGGGAGVQGPGVFEDGEVAGGEFGEGGEAEAGVGAEGIEAGEGGEGEGDGRLEAGDAHGFRVQVGPVIAELQCLVKDSIVGRIVFVAAQLRRGYWLARWEAQAPQIMAMGCRPAMAQPKVGMPRAT